MSTNFVLFSNLHILTLLIVIFIAYTLPTIYKNKDQKSKDFMSKTIAFIVLAHVISSPFKDLYFLENPYNWREVLPFHMCDLSEIFIAWFLLGGPKILFNCAFFWGLAGASMAMLTPDISFYDLDYLYFYIGHGMIVVAVMYAVIALKNRPYLNDVSQVIKITLFILLPITYLINLILGEPANFWYLMEKPGGASLMDIFPSPPFHLVVVAPIALALFYLLYLPYYFKDKKNT
jgi:hypothetical integral membrane protein (TIGR02206 family)